MNDLSDNCIQFEWILLESSRDTFYRREPANAFIAKPTAILFNCCHGKERCVRGAGPHRASECEKPKLRPLNASYARVLTHQIIRVVRHGSLSKSKLTAL